MLNRPNELLIAKAARAGDEATVITLLKKTSSICNFDDLIAELMLNGKRDIAFHLAKHQKSAHCFHELRESGLAKHYTTWETKLIGSMPGATLFGSTKKGYEKKVFIKKYRDKDTVLFDELEDFAAFIILKRCGARTPTVKLKGTKENSAANVRQTVYLFSTDIAQRVAKRPNRKYLYSNYEDCKIDFSDGSLNLPIDLFQEDATIISDTATKQRLKCYIDKTSIARIHLLGIILGLMDLSFSNVGYVISNDHGIFKSKFSVVDFFINIREIIISDDYNSIVKIVNLYGSGGPVSDFNDSLKESDYIDAFTKIEEHFILACDEAQDKIKQMSFETDGDKSNIFKKIDIWKINFMKIKELVFRSRSINQSPRI